MDDQEREPLLNHAADNGRWRDCAVQIPDPDEKLTDINECAASDSHRLYRICGRRRLKKCLSITCGLLLIFAIIIIVCWLTVVPAIINGQLSVVKIKVDDVQVFPGNAEGLDNQNSFEMTIQYSLQQLPSSSWNIVVSETAADILYNQTEIGSFPMSEMQIPKKGGSLTIQQTVIFTISNGKHWEAFAKDLLHRSEFTWQLSSRMCLTVLDAIGGSALSLPCVRIMKSIDLHGMDSLNRNASVQAIELPGNLPDDKGIIMKAETLIFNPSAVGIHLGDITLALLYIYHYDNDGAIPVTVGYVMARNMTLATGWNRIKLTGALMDPMLIGTEISCRGLHRLSLLANESPTAHHFDDEAKHREALGRFFTEFIVDKQPVGLLANGLMLGDLFEQCGIIPTSPPSSGVTPAAATTKVHWVEQLVKSVQLSINAQHDERRYGSLSVSNMTVDYMNFIINSNSPLPMQPLVSGLVHTRLSVPYPFPLAIEAVRIEMKVFRCPVEMGNDGKCSSGNSQSAVEFGRLNSGWGKTNSSQLIVNNVAEPSEGKVYTVSAFLSESTLIVERSGERQYKQFVRDLVRFRDVYMRASGTIEARIVTAAAHKDDPVVISGLPFDAVLRLNGLNGFQSDSASYSNDVIRVLDNLNVYGADTNGRLQFSISQAFIKRRQGLGRVGLLLDAPLEFELFHQPAVADVIDISDFDDSLSVADEWKKNNRLTVNSAQTEQQESLGIKLGTVLLPQLDLTSRASSCTNRLVNRVTNQSWQFPADRFVYCPLSTSGHFQLPTLERNDELCTDRRRCPARSFLTSYIGGHRYFGHGVSLSLKAMASGAIEDLELAIPFMIIRNITLPGYMTSSKSSSNTPPYPILRQIIVSPGKNIISGRLWCWLDFYNPLRVPLRFYYVDVNTYSDGVLIGNLNVNLTRYDPFELKQSYRFSGYPKRRIFNSDDTFGPHASDGCISMGDCQVGPIDLPTSVDSSVLTDRLEVSFNINSASVRAFWKSISQRSTNETITPVLAKGRVLIGIGAPTFNGPPRHDSGGAQRPDDPYWFPADPQREPVVLTWLDFGQRNTPMTFRQPSMPPPRWP